MDPIETEVLAEFDSWIRSRWKVKSTLSVHNFELISKRGRLYKSIPAFHFLWKEELTYFPLHLSVGRAKQQLSFIIPGGTLYWRRNPQISRWNDFEEAVERRYFMFRCNITMPI